MYELEVALIGVISSVLLVVMTYALNERTKRKTALADRLWEIKNENLCSINNILQDLRTLANHFYSVSRGYEAHFPDTFSRFSSIMAVSNDVSSRFMGCKYYLLDRDPREIDKSDVKTYESAKAELSSILLGLLLKKKQELYKPLSKIELIMMDNEVAYTIYKIMGIVQETTLQFESSNEEYENQLEMMDVLVLKFRNISRVELERTRTSKKIVFPS